MGQGSAMVQGIRTRALAEWPPGTVVDEALVDSEDEAKGVLYLVVLQEGGPFQVSWAHDTYVDDVEIAKYNSDLDTLRDMGVNVEFGRYDCIANELGSENADPEISRGTRYRWETVPREADAMEPAAAAGEHTVVSILDVRPLGGGRQVLVKWLFGEPTWEAFGKHKRGEAWQEYEARQATTPGPHLAGERGGMRGGGESPKQSPTIRYPPSLSPGGEDRGAEGDNGKERDGGATREMMDMLEAMRKENMAERKAAAADERRMMAKIEALQASAAEARGQAGLADEEVTVTSGRTGRPDVRLRDRGVVPEAQRREAPQAHMHEPAGASILREIEAESGIRAAAMERARVNTNSAFEQRFDDGTSFGREAGMWGEVHAASRDHHLASRKNMFAKWDGVTYEPQWLAQHVLPAADMGRDYKERPTMWSLVQVQGFDANLKYTGRCRMDLAAHHFENSCVKTLYGTGRKLWKLSTPR